VTLYGKLALKRNYETIEVTGTHKDKAWGCRDGGWMVIIYTN